MIYVVQKYNGKIMRARCRHCFHCQRGDTIRGEPHYLGKCYVRTDKDVCDIFEAVNLNSYPCGRFVPHIAYEIYQNQFQTSLNF